MKAWMIIFTLVLAMLGTSIPAAAAPIEVGDVRWGRSLEAAQETSKKSGKPILILFQEVPGCAGCQAFGGSVLKERLIVEAMEDLFVPLLILNNKGGEDRRLLKKFGEPSWNYQVIRYFDANLKELIPRRDRIWTTAGVARRMIESLKAHKSEVPLYLESVASLEETEHHREALFAMACFWVGEFELGKLAGVVKTEAGWYEGQEVTKVVYHTKKTTLKRLAEQAEKVRCAQKVYLPEGEKLTTRRIKTGIYTPAAYRKARASHQKKQIERWKVLAGVPGLNAMQLTRLNAWVPVRMEQAKRWLSPRQRAWLVEQMR